MPAAVEGAHDRRAECELCESMRPLHEAYGMVVCNACDERYLP